MYAVGRIGSYISRGVYTVSGPFHPFGGAVDIIVVEQPDGSFKSSPWYVRFGKFQGVLKRNEKVVSINVNGVDANFNMYLDHKGEAYFLKEVEVEDEGESVVYPSSSGDETDGQSNSNRRAVKSKSCNYDADKLNSADQINTSSAEIMARTGSRRARILGIVFGQRSRKEDNYQEGEGDIDMATLSSLQRAEIAADLLDLKWSTNLASGKSRKDNVSQISAHDVLDSKVAKDIQVNDEETHVESSVHNDGQNRNDHSILDEEIGSLSEQMARSSNFSSENLESSSMEEVSAKISCIGTMEQALESCTLAESIVEENSEVTRKMDKFDVGNAYQDEHQERTCPDSKIQYELEVSSGKQFDEEQPHDQKDVAVSGCRIPTETGPERVQSFVYCERSESSIVGLDGTKEKTQETLYLANGGYGEVHVHLETLQVTTELLPKLLEGHHQDTGVEKAKDTELEKEPVVVFEHHSDQVIPAPCVLEYTETVLESPLEVPESPTHMVSSGTILGSIEQANSQNSCTTPSDVRDTKDISDELHQYVESAGDSQGLYTDSVLTNAEINWPSESSEEEQFLFSDLDELKLSRIQFMDSGSRDSIKKGDHQAPCAEGIKEVNRSVNTNDESSSAPDLFGQYNQFSDLEKPTEKLRVMSNPISIHRDHMAAEEVGRLVESLPNMRSPTVKFGAHDCHHPLSHSLDSNSKSLKWTLYKENDSSCMKSDVDKEQHLAEEQPNIDEISQELNSVPSNPTVEISLCKPFLYEGMGAHAASQAFDAEKLDIDKFTSLGPAVLKNDRLVVRIGGRYFPWDVAAPIVLGMVAFGIKELFPSKGMIAVDRVEKSLIGVPGEAIVSPGGSWRLWPFNFRRSRSGKAMQPALSDTKSFEAEVAPESINDRDGTKRVCKPKVVKKIIRELTPTSEQLACLDLKEGRNTVTFTFSTAMLGKQQVDARIYLWKWNTRIVISDVDGTITKSDVLGQFMPLVGMDWSQTGVAHLFSAIKENGYQLLFLSARAISQAYHTRQFLFNLKQDGKALPDGPVVISPDGLFPSLIREVIRRAPHEFKISCLEVIRALFPSDCNPFYAGFGNRDTDEISYLKVGIPRGKIFTINPKGEIAVNRLVDTKSYSSLHALVHGMFPPTNSTEQEYYNSWNYWKLPPPDIDV